MIPAYNEEERIARSLRTALEYLSGKEFTWEIIVVDDGSKDRTAQVAIEADNNIKVLRQAKNYGKGAAVRRGMLEASGQLRIFSDADLSTPIYEIEKIIDTFKNGTEIFVGSRALDKSMIKEHQPFYREYMGKTFNFIVQSMVFKGIKDTQCGFKAFTAEAAEDIFGKARIDGFGFDVEILYLAKKGGYKIKEVPVEWYNDRRSTVNPFSDSWKMFLDALRVRRLHG